MNVFHVSRQGTDIHGAVSLRVQCMVIWWLGGSGESTGQGGHLTFNFALFYRQVDRLLRSKGGLAVSDKKKRREVSAPGNEPVSWWP